MKYIFRGNLCGYLCDDCSEPLFPVEVLLYQPWDKDNVLVNTVASTKDTFRLVEKKEIDERKGLLIARAKTDEKGNFEFVLDEKFSKTAFDIDFTCGTVPHKPPLPPRKEPLQFHLTTVLPQWRIDNQQESYFFYWKYCVTAKWWCYIRGHYFDAWVICGRIFLCDTDTPLPNVKVTAWDADLVSDDNLGSDITDANGHFRIDYTSAKFKVNFIPLNLETDKSWPFFTSGPDVYFKYEYNGIALQGETAANRRNNVGYCLCVKLCLKDVIPEEPPIIASFIKIGNNGNHFINETVASGDPNVIALATGKTQTGQAFFSCINLRGNLSKKLGGQPMEYRFETIETAGPGGAEIGTWKEVKPSQMCEAEIGNFLINTGDPMNPIALVPYKVGNVSGGVTLDGWIAVPQAANFAPNINGVLLSLNTASLNSNAVNMAGLVQGLSTTTKAPLQPNRFFKIRMRKRQVGIPLSELPAGVSNPIAMFNTSYQNVPKFGSWMPSLANEMGVACIDVLEMVGGGIGCTPITTAIHVKYTAANPNMGVVTLTLYGPGGPYAIRDIAPVSSVSETFGTAKELFNGAVVPINSLLNCAYTAYLSVELKLTDGENQHSNIEDWLSFCKSSPPTM